MDMVRNPAIVLDNCPGIDNAIASDLRTCINDRPGHHNSPRTDHGRSRYRGGGMNQSDSL
jgi:hypothetical protein